MNRSSAHFILRGLALLFLRYSAGTIVCKPYTWSTVKFEIFSYVLREIILCSKSNFSFDNRCLIWMGRANGGSRIVSDAAAVVPVGQVKGQRQALGHIPPPHAPNPNVWNLYPSWTLHTKNVTTHHIWAGATWHPFEGVRQKKMPSPQTDSTFLCRMRIFLEQKQ